MEGWKRLLTSADLANAVFVDFEARVSGPQILLGVSTSPEDFTQYVMDPVFWPAGSARAQGACERCWCVNTSFEQAVQAVTVIARLQGSVIVGFSKHELDVVLDAFPDLRDTWTEVYRDGKRTAKRWLRESHPGVSFERTPRSGRHTLDRYMDLAGYEVPTSYGTGNTGSRLAEVRRQLEAKGSYQALTPTAKGKWTKLLMHNYHDVFGLRAVLEKACAELGADW